MSSVTQEKLYRNLSGNVIDYVASNNGVSGKARLLLLASGGTVDAVFNNTIYIFF
jgi:hypothetical protein